VQAAILGVKLRHLPRWNERRAQVAARYRDAGCDGIFVPKVSDSATIAALVEGTELPLNVMMVPGLPSIAALKDLGARLSN
jgi:2-methylisocitrate lyase-like PEP mutase family enzyme